MGFFIDCKRTATGYEKVALRHDDQVWTKLEVGEKKLNLSALEGYEGQKIQINVPDGSPIICTICKDTKTGNMTYT